MRALLQIFIRNGGFFTFAVLELICAYLIVNFNGEQGKIYAHTATLIGGNINKQWRGVVDYIHLPDRLEQIAQENDSLKTLLLRMRTVQVPYRDTFFTVSFDTLKRKTYRPDFEFISAEVIGNNIGGSSNWITLNRGKNDGVTENSGVVTRQGVVESSLYILVGFAIGADRAPRLRPRMGKGIAMNATERAVAVVERMLAQPGFSATEPATRVLVAEITVAIARAQLEAQREIWQSLVDLAAPKVADAEEALAHLRQAEATLLALELTSHAPPVHGPEAEG